MNIEQCCLKLLFEDFLKKNIKSNLKRSSIKEGDIDSQLVFL